MIHRTLRELLAGPDSQPRTDESGPRVQVSLTLDQLAFTTLHFDDAALGAGSLSRVRELQVFWDRAYRDTHALLGQPLDLADTKGDVFIPGLLGWVDTRRDRSET